MRNHELLESGMTTTNGINLSTRMDAMSDKLMEAQLLLVRARLVTLLGCSVVSCFQIVPSGNLPDGRPMAALLVDAHLPILVPLRDTDELWPAYFTASYDVFGRKTDANGLSADAELERFDTLGEALAWTDLGFRKLKHESETRRSCRFYGVNMGHLPEEQWLHEQLCGPAHGSDGPEAVSGVCDPAELDRNLW